MPVTVTCTCGLAYQVPGSRAGSKMACRCGRTVVVPMRERTPPPATLPPDGSGGVADDDLIHGIKRMLRTRELPLAGKCPLSGKPADDVVVFRLHFDPEAERRLAEDAVQKASGWSLFGWLGGRSAAATDEAETARRDVWVDMPLRVAREAHAELIHTTSQKQFRDLLRTVPIYARLLAAHPTARIEILPRHSDGQPAQRPRG